MILYPLFNVTGLGDVVAFGGYYVAFVVYCAALFVAVPGALCRFIGVVVVVVVHYIYAFILLRLWLLHSVARCCVRCCGCSLVRVVVRCCHVCRWTPLPLFVAVVVVPVTPVRVTRCRSVVELRCYTPILLLLLLFAFLYFVVVVGFPRCCPVRCPFTFTLLLLLTFVRLVNVVVVIGYVTILLRCVVARIVTFICYVTVVAPPRYVW